MFDIVIGQGLASDLGVIMYRKKIPIKGYDGVITKLLASTF